MKPSIFDRIFNGDSIKTEQVNPDKNNTPFLSLVLKPGMKLWKVEIKTGEVTEAEYKEITSDFKTGSVSKKLIVQDGFRYIPAINRKNAIRKAILRTI